jgi:hypothetical protein
MLTAIDEQHGTHALGFELLEVARDARLVHKGVHPPLIDPGEGFDRRVLKLIREIFRREKAARKRHRKSEDVCCFHK